jgi:segregation and condensation protein B
MSLKAKLEAVIYAAEEPVTLAQFAALFADEALEWKAAEEAASAAQPGEQAAAEPLLAVNEEFAYTELETVTAEISEAIEVPVEAVGQTAPESAPQPTAETGPGIAPEPSIEPGVEPSIEPGVEPSVEPGVEPSVEPGLEQDLNAPPAAEDGTATVEAAEDDTAAIEATADADAKRQARQRDREVRLIIRQLLDELIASYASDGRGVEIREIAGGYRMATKPECHDAVRMFVKSLKPALKLSLPALETLAVIAYKQPVTAPEVNEIRGVDSSGVFGSLLARKLIATAGRKPVIGRPILYKTTREFLLRFGLKDVAELPSMEEFEKMASIELDEPEPETAPDAVPHSGSVAGPEFDEAASEEMEESAQPDDAPEAATPENEVATNPPEAAPVAPSTADQAETETSPHE